MMSDQVNAELINELPYFIAVNFKKMLEAPDAFARVDSGLATFERSLRLLTIILTSQYMVHDKTILSEPILNKLLLEKLSPGNLSDWEKIFITTLRVYEGQPELFFIPELYNLFWDTTNPEKHHLKKKILAKVSRLVVLNNDWQYKMDLPENGDGWNKLAEEIQFEVNEWMSLTAFMTNYELLLISSENQNRYSAKRHRGLEIADLNFFCEDTPLQSDWYYLAKNRCDFLPLDPLLTPWHSKDGEAALFRGFTTYHKLHYLLALSSEFADDQIIFEKITGLLFEVQNIKEDELRKGEDLSWLQVLSTFSRLTGNWMGTATNKYDPGVYLQRVELLGTFKAFIKSKKTCFVLLGKSGAGKSNFVLSLQDEFRDEQDVGLLLIDASQIDTSNDLLTTISNDFCRIGKFGSGRQIDIWEEIDQLPGMDQRTILMVLDAINENENAPALLRDVSTLLSRSYSWLKILISSRPEAWENITESWQINESKFYTADTTVGRNAYLAGYQLEGFSSSELFDVYALYARKYSLKTPFNEIAPELIELFQEPLQLWMLAATYSGKDIPESLSTGDLVNQYIGTLLDTKRLSLGDLIMLRSEIVPLFANKIGSYSHLVTGHILDQARDQLKGRIFDEGYLSSGKKISQAFQNLMDARILTKSQRGMQFEVWFPIERFYDHLIGQHIFDSYVKDSDAQLQICEELIHDIETFPFIWGAVEHVLYLIAGESHEVIQNLAFTNSLNNSHLISSALINLAYKNRKDAGTIAQHIIDASVANRSQTSIMKRLYAVEISLQIASGIGRDDLFIQVLKNKEPILRDAGIRYLFYLNKSNPKRAMHVFSQLCNQANSKGFLPDLLAVQSAIRVAPLLALDYEHSGGVENPLFPELVNNLQYLAQSIQKKPAIKLLGKIGMRLALSAGVRMLTEIIQLDKAKSMVNPYQLAKFFRHDAEKRSEYRSIIAFFDKTKELTEEVRQNLPKYVAADQLTCLLVETVLVSRGIYDPEDVLPILEKINQIEPENALGPAVASHSWYSILERQELVTPEQLSSLEKFVRDFIDLGKHGYGKSFRNNQTSDYYYLNTYGAIWNKVHPGEPIPLYYEYINRSLVENDRPLQLYLIDTFGERRYPLPDYLPALRALTPYISNNPDEEMIDHIINSLGSLRGMAPKPVDRFLTEIKAPRDIINGIRSQSYQKPTSELYMNFVELWNDLIAKMPGGFVNRVINVLDCALQAKSFSRMVTIVVEGILNGFSM